MSKKIFLIFSILCAVLFLGVFWYTALPAAQTYCGDEIIQSPNDDGEFEKCDDGPSGSASCTATCGEKMLGWAWSPNSGWISLNHQNCTLLPSGTCNNNADYFVSIDSDNQIRGWAWSENAGWICFGQTCDQANICNNLSGCNPINFGTAIPQIKGVSAWQARIESGQPEVANVLGWGKILALKDDGWVSFSCENNNSCATSNYEMSITKSTFNFDGQDQKRYSLNGWAYNGSSVDYSFGWFSFSPTIAAINPWLQAQSGDVYAQKGIEGTLAPATAYNATYRILSNQAITGFSSAQAEALWIDPTYGQINFPSTQTRYSNALGSLDVDGLLCDGQTTCTNKYGITVIKSTLPLSGNNVLGNKVYFVNSNWNIHVNAEFKNGTGYESGAGTVIVNGNVTINGDLTYQSSAAETRFKNLASLAWIIKGDLKIKGSVKNVAGNFIVLGNGTPCAESGEGPAGCGQVFSCYDGDCNTAPLTVNGFIMARKFNFNRTYSVNPPAVQPAESVVYDGRLLANTPPGLADFAKAMPLWRSDFSGQ